MTRTTEFLPVRCDKKIRLHIKQGHGHEHGRGSTRTDTLSVTATDAGNDYKQCTKLTQTYTPLWTYTNTDHHQTQTRKQTQSPTLCDDSLTTCTCGCDNSLTTCVYVC